MLFELKSYLKFLVKSTNQHGVHSPFVYNLVTNCFYDTTKYAEYSLLNKYRKAVLTKENPNSKISKKRMQFLFRVVHYFKPHSILETGTPLGLTTYALSLGKSKTIIKRFEGCSKNQIECRTTTLKEYMKDCQLNINNCQLIVFNKSISNKEILDNFKNLLPTITNKSVWLFNGIHSTKDREKTWEIIKNNPKVKVTIDTFQWGIVFFRAEQEKEHFVVRV